jgi:hypothetical protein
LLPGWVGQLRVVLSDRFLAAARWVISAAIAPLQVLGAFVVVGAIAWLSLKK